jgi:multiple sugar transport system permease protein
MDARAGQGLGMNMSVNDAPVVRPPVRVVFRRELARAAFAALALALLLLFAFPFWWMVQASLRLPRDVSAFPPDLLFTPNFDQYRAALSKPDFWRRTLNSLIVALGALALGLAVGLPAAYAVARFKIRIVPMTVLVVRMIPGVVFMLPLFLVYRELGFLDTHVGLIIAHLIITLPLAIWIMMGFFEDVPVEVEQAALIDGCSRWGVFWRIALPLSLPGISVTAILAFITSWNDLVFVLILGGTDTRTLPGSVLAHMGFDTLNFAGIAASATLLSAPVIVLAILAQRWLVGGLTVGAVK